MNVTDRYRCNACAYQWDENSHDKPVRDSDGKYLIGYNRMGGPKRPDDSEGCPHCGSLYMKWLTRRLG